MKDPRDGLVLSFDPPVGPEPTRSRVTNASRQLAATVCDTDGREIRLAPGESAEAVFRFGTITRG